MRPGWHRDTSTGVAAQHRSPVRTGSVASRGALSALPIVLAVLLTTMLAAPAAAITAGAAGMSPDATTPSSAITGAVKLSTWTTYFVPSSHNGYGANIWVPARIFDHMEIRPGQRFDFWTALGPVTWERGFRLGGAIVNGRSQEGVAMGGGICAASTTLFNVAVRAGLTINVRYPHTYYITRYPIGLDATVSKSAGGGGQTMAFTNDTPNPIEIRGYALKTGKTGVRFELWGLPTGRTVTFTKPTIRNYHHAVTYYVHTSALRDGTYRRIEYTVDGFDAWVTRWVRDAASKVIHHETYVSHYRTINGTVLVGDHHAPYIPAPPHAPGG